MAVSMAFMTPRRLGSAASGPRKPWAAISWFRVDCTSERGSSSSPSLWKKGPPFGRRTLMNRPDWACSAWVSRPAADSASSGVWPSITTAVTSSFCGKAEAMRALFWRHFSLGEISAAVSVDMAKWPAVYQPAPNASRRPSAPTSQAERQLAATTRAMREGFTAKMILRPRAGARIELVPAKPHQVQARDYKLDNAKLRRKDGA